MAFRYRHRIHFRDTDAAGVVFFSNVFSFFHAAYEASLAASGVDIQQFFRPVDLAVPIIHSECDFFRPMHCGETYDILLTPNQEGANAFSIVYQSFKVDEAIAPPPLSTQFSTIESEHWADADEADFANRKKSAKALTRHVAIHPGDRQRVDLPPMLLSWIEQWSR